MKVYYSVNHFPPEVNTVVTIGTFDGIHSGHQFILKRLNNIAKEKTLSSVVFTFDSHPRHVLFPENQDLRLLNSVNEKVKELERIGIDYCIIHKFTKEFSRIDSIHFVRDILVNKLNMKYMMVGHDHHFGRNREGSYDELLRLSDLYAFNLEEAPPQKIDKLTVSSTKIRNYLLNGELKKANSLLGYNYTLTGVVYKNEQLGRKIGFPTANIRIDDKWKLVPLEGVYIIKTCIDNQNYFGMLNIGVPSLGSKKYQVEVYIFNFSKDIYNKEISIEIIKRLRNKKVFRNLEDLKSQLTKDEINCKRFLKL